MANNQAVINFIQQIAPYIVTEGQKRGYKVYSTVIAQAVIESRYGLSTLATKAHNYFGLKCGTAWVVSGKPSIVLSTKEEYKPGVLTSIKDAFRVYPDMKAGVAGYYDFISTKRYQNLKTAVTYRQYAELLKADGYATSSSYVNTLCQNVEQYGLIVYDTGGSVVPLPQWEVGKTYTTQQDLNVRQEPNGEFVPFDNLTEDAKKHAFVSTTGHAVLKRGTRVTVKEVRESGSTIWLRVPSGWICGKNSRNIYVL